MAAKRPSVLLDLLARDKLLERIGRRYEQLDGKLDELEAKLEEMDNSQANEPTIPRKPR